MICLSITGEALSQIGFFIPEGRQKVEIPFEYVNQFIIVTLDYKGFFPLKFIFDTGAEHTILTKPEIAKVFNMEYERSFKVLGSDLKTELTAYLVRRVPFSIDEKVKAPFQDILVLEKDYFRFEEHVGIPIHGILSAKAFSRYLVQINYDKRVITLHSPERNKRFIKNYEKVELNIARNKPYLDTKLYLQNDTVLDVRLLMDTGAAISLLLFPESHPDLVPPPNSISGNFGKGLGGYLNGFSGRINKLDIGSMKQQGVISFFQKIDTTEKSVLLNDRNGILGNAVLERFHLIFDYRDKALYIRPARLYSEKYKYDKSGLHIIATGKNLNKYLIQYIIQNSPGAEVGFKKGDQILSINRIPIKLLNLQGINRKFQKKDGKEIRLKIKRDGKKMIKKLTLRELL